MAVAGVFGLVALAVSVTVVSVPAMALAGVAVTELITGGTGGGGPTTTTTAAPTASAAGHRVEWKTGSAIGSAQGAGSSWPTTVVAVPGPPSGPEPQNRNGRSWKLAGMIGPPKARFSPKMNKKLGKVNWPSARPF